MNHPAQLWKLIRPSQWIKNSFVFTGILFANAWGNIPLLISVAMATIAFCFMSSAVYVFNDVLDREKDLAHPKKKSRPVASGAVSVQAALILSIILAILGGLLAWIVSLKVFLIILGYFILNVAYSIRLKDVVILDVFCIATGFMFRILAGTAGVGIPPSKWLILCGLMITLFLGFAKRRAEIIALAQKKEEHRSVLLLYGPLLLDEMIGITASCVIVTYSLYTMSPETIRIHHTENLVYTVPLVMYGLFRYIFLLHHRQQGGDPSRDLLKDRHMVGIVIGWFVFTLLIFLRGQHT